MYCVSINMYNLKAMLRSTCNDNLVLFCKNGCLLPKCGWTEVGRKIQSLSSIRPDSVQSLSNNRSCTESVLCLSKPGSNSVKPIVNFKKCEQTSEIRIQSMSKYFPHQLRKKFQTGQNLDKVWTCKNCGQVSHFGVRLG